METDRADRPLESLEWYRDAVRSNRPDERGVVPVLSWLRGVEFLTAHISVFAVGIVALIVINLLRSPEDLWVDRAGAAWALLLVIHGVAIGLLWAIELLQKDDEAPQMVPGDHWQNASASWPRTVRMVPPGEVHAGSAPPDSPWSGVERSVDDSLRPLPPAADGKQSQPMPPGWSAWEQGAGHSPPPDESKASWKEASTWLTRRTRGRQPGPTERSGGGSSESGGSSPK